LHRAGAEEKRLTQPRREHGRRPPVQKLIKIVRITHTRIKCRHDGGVIHLHPADIFLNAPLNLRKEDIHVMIKRVLIKAAVYVSDPGFLELYCRVFGAPASLPR
jgi:hypothetical protein